MALTSVMSSQERAAAAAWTDTENRRLALEFNQRNAQPNQTLGKDEFLRILLTQLAHQDPTAPMQDKEFIAQMAQFSSLEQMTNLATDFARMARVLQASEATGALGKTVEIHLENETVQGVIRAITRGETPQILVNGRFFDWDQVSTIFDEL
jgi:flagellar basal-body rod modification protein FlgD